MTANVVRLGLRTFAILFISSLSTYVFAAQDCELNGQYLVVEHKGGLKIGLCRKDPLGMSAENSYHSTELSEILTKKKDDPKLFEALAQVDIGKDYESALKAVREFKGLLVVTGENKDRQALEYIANAMNDADGVSQRLKVHRENAAKEEQLREARKATPVKLTLDGIKSMTEHNRIVAAKMNPSHCRSASADSIEQLKVIRVVFEDGEEALLLPYEGKPLDTKRFSFSSPNSGKAIGGLQFGEGPKKIRQLRFDGDKVFWTSPKLNADGTSKLVEYGIKEFYEISAKDALGWARPINGGDTYDRCFYARLIGPTGADKDGVGTSQ